MSGLLWLGALAYIALDTSHSRDSPEIVCFAIRDGRPKDNGVWLITGRGRKFYGGVAVSHHEIPPGASSGTRTAKLKLRRLFFKILVTSHRGLRRAHLGSARR